MGIIKRIFKTIQVRGQILNNVLFIELIPKKLYEVTFLKDIEEIKFKTYVQNLLYIL